VNLLLFSLGQRFTRPVALVDDRHLDDTTVVGATCLTAGETAGVSASGCANAAARRGSQRSGRPGLSNAARDRPPA
jgi:hypothetical protein